MIVLSTLATGPLERILHDGSLEVSDLDTTRTIENNFADHLGIEAFHSTLIRDDLVLRSIVEELDSRQSCENREQKRIAIISEQDSVYGRLMDDVVEGEIEDIDANLSCDYEVDEYGYLRGMDGELPANAVGTAGMGEREATTPNAYSSSSFIASFFQPGSKEPDVGPTQYDYISRLAIEIADSDNGEDEVIAVGILGSDVYDKLVILQALKYRIPNAVFFTTDLDTRFYGSEVYSWTQNLLIGATYGLKIADQETPAFRDSYQTAMFRAAKLAITEIEEPEPGEETVDTFSITRPLVYEIARSGPIYLRDQPRRLDDDLEVIASTKADEMEVHGEFSLLGDGFILGPIHQKHLLILPLIILCIVSVRRYLSNRSKEDELELFSRSDSFKANIYKIPTVITSIASLIPFNSKDLVLANCYKVTSYISFLAILASFYLLNSDLFSHEPIYMFQGVSAIPTYYLQQVTFVIALCFCILWWGITTQGINDIEDKFLPEAKKDDANPETKEETSNETSDATILDVSWKDSWMSLQRSLCSTSKIIWCGIAAAAATTLAGFIINNSPSPALVFKPWDPGNSGRLFTIYIALFNLFICSSSLFGAKKLMKGIIAKDDIPWQSGNEILNGFDDSIKIWCHKMRVIVRVTEIVAPLVYMPCLVIGFLLLVRNNLFEGWVWTPSLIILYIAFVCLILWSSVVFQNSATTCRNNVLKKLRRFRASFVADEKSMKRIELAIEDIELDHRGAFAHWTEHPIFKAIALPSGGLGLLALLA